MPFDSSQQGEYLTSQWLQKYFPRVSQAVREKYERGFNLRKIRDPQTYDFPIVQSQNRGGPLSLPQPVNYAAPTVATSYMGHGLGSGGAAPFSGGRSGFETGASGTVSNQMSDDWVSTSSAYSAPVDSTSGADPTTGGGDTPSGDSTSDGGTIAVILTTGDGPRPPTQPPTPPVPDPPAPSPGLPTDPDAPVTMCGPDATWDPDSLCLAEYGPGVGTIVPGMGGDDVPPVICSGVCGIYYEGAPFSGEPWSVYFSACRCYHKDCFLPPAHTRDCVQVDVCCFTQRQDYNADNVYLGTTSGAFLKTIIVDCCV